MSPETPERLLAVGLGVAGRHAPPRGSRAIGYVSVALGGADDRDAQAQAAAIEDECARRGFVLQKIVRDAEPHGTATTHRPGLSHALEQLAEGAASVLVVSALERLSRSVVELGAVFEWFSESDAILVVVDHHLDTAGPAGQLVSAVVRAMGLLEHRRVADRTRRGLVAARAKGPAGRPAVRDIPVLRDRIAALRREGLTLQAIADQLNEQGVPTLRGGARWRPSSVQSALGYKRPRRGPTRIDLPPPRSGETGAEDAPPER